MERQYAKRAFAERNADAYFGCACWLCDLRCAIQVSPRARGGDELDPLPGDRILDLGQRLARANEGSVAPNIPTRHRWRRRLVSTLRFDWNRNACRIALGGSLIGLILSFVLLFTMGLNFGIHDALNLTEKMGAVYRGDASEDVSMLYDRQRRTVAEEYLLAQTAQNKRDLEESDPEGRAQRQKEWRETADNPEAAREFLLRTAMFKSVERERSIQ